MGLGQSHSTNSQTAGSPPSPAAAPLAPRAVEPGPVERADVGSLAKEFHLDRGVVQSLYDNFRAHVHGEFVDKPTFKEILRKSGVENERVADHWFDICDPDHDGKIVFREFLTSVTLMERGGWKERAEFAFKCYDIDGNGAISKDELYNMLLCTNKFVDRLTEHTLHKPRDTAEQRAQFATQKAFEYADSNADGQISLEEFMNWVRDSMIFESGVDIFLPASTAMAALVAETPQPGSPPRSRAGSLASPRPLP